MITQNREKNKSAWRKKIKINIKSIGIEQNNKKTKKKYLNIAQLLPAKTNNIKKLS